jgi:hypothetical protein
MSAARVPLCEHLKFETFRSDTRDHEYGRDVIVSHLRCLVCGMLFSRSRPAKEEV